MKAHRFSQIKAAEFADCHRLAVPASIHGRICSTVSPFPRRFLIQRRIPSTPNRL